MQTTLVSVAVITYNSSNTILETLNSIKSQTYNNIELIISDDGSTDNTIKICKEWVECNKERFKRFIIKESTNNRGVSYNVNQAYSECNGEWIKIIAGDDILRENCIELYIDYLKFNHDAKVIFAKALRFEEIDGEKRYDITLPNESLTYIYDLSAEEQLKKYMSHTFMISPTLFINRLVAQTNKLNNIYVYLDDLPYYITLLNKGFKFYFLNEITVYYRYSSASLSQAYNQIFPPKMYMSLIINFYLEKQDILKNILPSQIEKDKKLFLLWAMSELFLHNKTTKWNKFIYKIFRRIINSFSYTSSKINWKHLIIGKS